MRWHVDGDEHATNSGPPELNVTLPRASSFELGREGDASEIGGRADFGMGGGGHGGGEDTANLSNAINERCSRGKSHVL